MGAAVGDHPAVQGLDPLAGGPLAKAGDESVQEAGAAREKQASGKGKSDPLMLEIAFADRLRMADEQTRKHGQDPVQSREKSIALFLENVPVYYRLSVNLRENIP